ncbi:MAG TPA: class I SAM-dependent methyltransferase, partial [Ktedonobacteraceae bacterium]|nr:class I SAM-dependent methyltransferase [Ktedonobacteraceae bacterium]
MSDLIDQHYLLTDQYNNAQKLEARIQLHQRFSTNTYDWHRWVFDHLTIPPDSRILELGCGPADLWRKNADRIPENWHITLSDFSPGMLQEARQ